MVFRYSEEGEYMNIYVYGKSTEDFSVFNNVINLLGNENTNIELTIENRRSFRELEILERNCKNESILLISSISSLGITEADIANQLDYIISHDILLVVCDMPSTYQFGVSQPMNKAITSTILQSILSNNKKIISMPKKSTVGRNKIAFPDNWDELYEKWENKEISSKEFIQLSGLKKATFYNLMTEYKELQRIKEEYIQKYKNA